MRFSSIHRRLCPFLTKGTAASFGASRRLTINSIGSSNNIKFVHYLPKFTCTAITQGIRKYGAAAGPTLSQTQERAMLVLKNFDKIDSEKLSLETPWTRLGLDSLDVVEVMIKLEEEFHIEIPDVAADKAQSPKEIAEYICGFLNPHKKNAEPDNFSEQQGH